MNLGQPLAMLPSVIKDEHPEQELMVVIINKEELSLDWGAILDFPLCARGLESKLSKIIFLHISSPDSCISFFLFFTNRAICHLPFISPPPAFSQLICESK